MPSESWYGRCGSEKAMLVPEAFVTVDASSNILAIICREMIYSAVVKRVGIIPANRTRHPEA
jgi:hypothetical protein